MHGSSLKVKFKQFKSFHVDKELHRQQKQKHYVSLPCRGGGAWFWMLWHFYWFLHCSLLLYTMYLELLWLQNVNKNFQIILTLNQCSSLKIKKYMAMLGIKMWWAYRIKCQNGVTWNWSVYKQFSLNWYLSKQFYITSIIWPYAISDCSFCQLTTKVAVDVYGAAPEMDTTPMLSSFLAILGMATILFVVSYLRFRKKVIEGLEEQEMYDNNNSHM